MKKNDQWMYGGIVRSLWGVDDRTLAAIVYDNKIPAYDIHYERLDPEEALHTFIEDQKFRSEDIEKFASENGHMLDIDKHYSKIVLNAKDKRELGQLRRQKEKWDASINVAVKIGVYCQEQNRILNRHEIWDQVIHIDKNLPDTTIEKIWKAIPEQFRSKGGHPKKQ
jgi:hypothetical protein